jgi:glycosyltransferase involved in cell wall biosynthesis
MHNSIIIGVEAESLVNFRGELLKSMVACNSNVTTLSNKPTNIQASNLKSLGVNSKFVTFSRGKLSIISDLKVFIELVNKYVDIRPDIILAYTIKPVIWGGLASRFFKTDFYALITGLGFAFQGSSFRRRLLTKLVVFLYRFALKKTKIIIFQNSENRDIFISKGIVELSKTCIVNGSGVNLKKYDIERLPNTEINFLCISRLLSEKGLREYAKAAKIVKNKFPNVEFTLVGPEDLSPDAIPLNEVGSWSDYINYKGVADDVRPYIKNSHVYVLPSYHEGIPRSTLEAMSMGRPVLTTNAVGCKETVEEGINGFKVLVKSPEALAKKMIWFIENSAQIEQMGAESRKIAEDKFDVHKVNKEMLKIMGIK